MNTRSYLLFTLVGALAVAAPGCGDSAECGPFTTNVDGVCVIDDLCPDGQAWDDVANECVGANNCAEGTMADGMGNCVPDFSIICTGNTVLNPATGECEVDPNACGVNTTLVNGECITVDDSLTADVAEPAEPNGLNPGDTPGQFTLPANVGDTVTIKVNSNPFEDVDSDGILDTDFDVFLAVASEPGRYSVRVDALNGGGVGGFLALAAGSEVLADWRRFGITNARDWVDREVFLAEAGTYAFAFADSRALVTGFGNGSPESDMFITITKLDLPTPIAMTQNATTGDWEGIGNEEGQVKCYSATVDAFDLFFGGIAQDAAIGSLNLGMVVLTENVAISSVEEGGGVLAASQGAPASQTLLACVDPVWDYAYSVGNKSYVATISQEATQAIPDDGSTVTWGFEDGQNNFGHFSGEADSVHRFQMDSPSGDAIDILIVDPSFNVVFATTGVTSVDEFIWLKTTGEYFVQVFNNDGVDGNTFDLTFTRAAIVPSLITLGTPITGATLSATHGRDFYILDLSGSEWFELGPTLTNFTGDLSFDIYGFDAPGALDTDIFSQETITGTDGNYTGRVNLGATGYGQILVSVTDDGGADADETYDMDVRERPHSTYAVSPAAATSEIISLLADTTGYFLLTFVPTETAELLITATAATPNEAALTILDREDNVTDTAGDASQISVISTIGWVAGSVDEVAGVAGDITLDVTALPPNLVTIIGDPAATTPPLVDQDDGLSTAGITLPFAFNIGGTAVTEFTLDSNGRAVFIVDYFNTGASEFTNLGIPDVTDSPYIALPWDDYEATTFYVKSEATQVTIEMVGNYWFTSTPVHSQIILRDDNTMDFIMGIDHVDDCGATLGVQENDTTGLELTFDTCNQYTAPNALTTVNASTLTIVP